MSIVRARLKPYSLPLRDPWPSADGDVRDRKGWILALEDELGRIGLGDAAPFPGFGLETHASAGAGLRLAMSHLVGMERERYPTALVDLPLLAPVAAAPTARSAIDCAIHDLISQGANVSLARYLGGSGTLREVPVNVTIPRVPPERGAELGKKAVAAGVRTLKLKVGGAAPQDDEARLRALRQAVGPEVRLRVDANQAWSVEEAIQALCRFAAYDLEYAEQPVGADDLEGLIRVREGSPVRIAADEAVRDTRSAEMLLYRSAADILILKPMALGGLRESRSVLNAADDRHVPVVVTSLMESAVGRAAAIHFAASLGTTQYAHGLATGEALSRDIALAPALQRGSIPVPDTPGLGVRPPEEFWQDAFTLEPE
ncbi:MAG TPA: enolase C-terminal domain-like protein [Candidatus Dormibacteraeota bacterium]|nr:enolase C-terminal domain-like protein [Candidatus Dormibacteraeota bacterium]